MKERIGKAREEIRSRISPRLIFIIGMLLIGVLIVAFLVYALPMSYEAFQQASISDAQMIKASMTEISPPSYWQYERVRAVVHCPGDEPFLVTSGKTFGSNLEGCIYYMPNGVRLETSTRFFSKKGSVYFSTPDN